MVAIIEEEFILHLPIALSIWNLILKNVVIKVPTLTG